MSLIFLLTLATGSDTSAEDFFGNLKTAEEAFTLVGSTQAVGGHGLSGIKICRLAFNNPIRLAV